MPCRTKISPIINTQAFYPTSAFTFERPYFGTCIKHSVYLQTFLEKVPPFFCHRMLWKQIGCLHRDTPTISGHISGTCQWIPDGIHLFKHIHVATENKQSVHCFPLLFRQTPGMKQVSFYQLGIYRTMFYRMNPRIKIQSHRIISKSGRNHILIETFRCLSGMILCKQVLRLFFVISIFKFPIFYPIQA